MTKVSTRHTEFVSGESGIASPIPSRHLLIALWIIAMFPNVVLGDPTCGELDEPSSGGSETIDAIGTQRALFIFARFPDGQDIGPGGQPNPECGNCGNTWTAAMLDTLPAFADSLLEDADPPTMEGSLSHFFFTMSNGLHKLKGTTFPAVVTSDTSIVEYRTLGADIYRANRHILEKVWTCPG